MSERLAFGLINMHSSYSCKDVPLKHPRAAMEAQHQGLSSLRTATLQRHDQYGLQQPGLQARASVHTQHTHNNAQTEMIIGQLGTLALLTLRHGCGHPQSIHQRFSPI